MLDLEQFRVGDLPTLYYVPDAITPAEEQSLLTHITASKQQWKTVSGRRLQNLGGIVHKKGLLPAPLPSWLQPLLGKLAADTGAYGEGQAPNHVLINAYQPGEGIMPHEASAAGGPGGPGDRGDGPLYHPVVVILSLQNPAVVRFARKRQEGQQGDAAAAAEGTESHARAGQLVASVACMPRSLLIFKDEAYSGCLHGILEAAVEDIDASVVNAQQAGLQIGQALPRGGERISLTVRRVLHTYSLGLRL